MGPTSTVRISELIQFTERQLQAWQALFAHRFVLYGGARGGGKSRFLRWALLLLLIYWYGKGYRRVIVGLFCSTYNELRDRQISKIASEFPDWLGEIKDTQEFGLGFYLREEYGGGIIALRNLDDPNKYKGAEFAAIGVDELTLILKDIFDILRGSLRWPGIEHTVFIGATNPDGVGNLWVRELWIERQFPPEMQAIAPKFSFVQALPADNPHLPAEYWDDLKSQPPDIQKAWIEGDWYVFKGQAFKVFRRERHVIPPIEIPEHWRRYRGIDWGKSAPFVCLWGAVNPDNGRWIVYREVALADLEDREQARTITDMTPASERIITTYADPSIWGEKQKGVTSTAVIYAQNGVPVTQANNHRLDGKRRVDRLLAPLADGEPGLLIFETCPYLARTLPALVYDRVQIEDINTKGEDHAYDALRYLTSPATDAKPASRTPNQPAPIKRMFRR
jgi:hypothetical protein